MGMFDQTARLGIKYDPAQILPWMLRRAQVQLLFHVWLDTRRLPFPGDPDRTGDLVADCTVVGQPDQHHGLIVEVQTEPDPNIDERVGIYALMVRLEMRTGPGPDDKLPVGAVIVNLTGVGKTTGLQMPLPGAPTLGLTVAPVVFNLIEIDAAATLAEMAARQTGFPVLIFIPLMRGGGEVANIQEWARVCRMETDAKRQATYAALALVFAELTRSLVDWQRALGGWNVRESQIILGWKREGRQEGEVEKARTYLLRLIQAKFENPVSETLRLAIEGTNDLDTLDRWFDAALSLNTLPEFRSAMTAPP
jgi:hypothetical protein